MWWMDIIVVAVLALGVYCFITLVRGKGRRIRRYNTRTVESMYDQYADSPRKQRRFAREHGGDWRDDGASRQPGVPGAPGAADR
jgi:hypothetical protein